MMKTRMIFSTTTTIVSVAVCLLLVSCDKDDDIINGEILGKWESTTFEVTSCVDIRNNVEMRTCDFSDNDDVECATLDFRSDGRVFSTDGPVESADTYTTDEDQLTITAGPEPDETATFRFSIDGDTLKLLVTDFNDHGCYLTTNLVRVN